MDPQKRSALAQALKSREPWTLEKETENVFGMKPGLVRGNVLPLPDGDGGIMAPQWLYEMGKAVLLPSHVAKGGDWSLEDVTNMALTVGGTAGAASLAGGVPKGALAMGAVKRGADDLPMDTASRMARAKDMGFYESMPLYYGSADDIKFFDRSLAGNTSGSRAAQTGVSVAQNPDVANEFSGIARSMKGADAGENVMPLLHRADKPARIDLDGSEKDHEIAATLDHLFSSGYDAVQLRNYTTPSGESGGNIIFVKDPSQLRSRFAKFDPEKRDSADLLAASGSPAGLLATPREDEPKQPNAKQMLMHYLNGGA